ncbi:MAG: hypothetical protein ACREJB_08940, partial [Planctomycetaceae bacterium]
MRSHSGSSNQPEIHDLHGPHGGTAAERFRRAILAGLERFVALLDLQGRVLECPTSPSRELTGRPFWQAPCWENSQEIRAQVRAAVAAAAGGERVRFELPMCGGPDDGSLASPERPGFGPGEPSRVTLDVSLKPLRDESGRIEFQLAEGWNVTDRKAAEREEARKSQETQALCERLQ